MRFLDGFSATGLVQRRTAMTRHGGKLPAVIVTLIIVIVAMLIAEQAVVRLYRWLGDGTN
jgi:hypothetical protein